MTNKPYVQAPATAPRRLVALGLPMLAFGRVWPTNADAMPASPHTAPIEAILVRVIASYDEAWNRHDARARATHFSADAEFFSVEGMRYVGREVIERHHGELFADRLRGSVRVTSGITVVPEHATSARVEVRWRASNEINMDRTPRPSRVGTTMLWMGQDADGAWRIRTFRATHSRS